MIPLEECFGLSHLLHFHHCCTLKAIAMEGGPKFASGSAEHASYKIYDPIVTRSSGGLSYGYCRYGEVTFFGDGIPPCFILFNLENKVQVYTHALMLGGHEHLVTPYVIITDAELNTEAGMIKKYVIAIPQIEGFLTRRDQSGYPFDLGMTIDEVYLEILEHWPTLIPTVHLSPSCSWICGTTGPTY